VTTISASSAIGVTLTSASYANPIVVTSGVTISSDNYGVWAPAGSWAIQNSGSILGSPTSSTGKGVFLGAGGSVANETTALISGYVGIYGSGGAVTVVNAGSILGNAPIASGLDVGVYLHAGGSVINQNGALISGVHGIAGYGTALSEVNPTSNAVTVVNAGSIAGSDGDGTELRGGGRRHQPEQWHDQRRI
jgi:fibronectin-binding autotransporter adhesin